LKNTGPIIMYHNYSLTGHRGDSY